MIKAILHRIGMAIDNTARAIYRRVLGLRIPASRIRLSDIEIDRDFCAQRLADAHADSRYWRDQLVRAEEALAKAEWEHSRLLHALDQHDNPTLRRCI